MGPGGFGTGAGFAYVPFTQISSEVEEHEATRRAVAIGVA